MEKSFFEERFGKVMCFTCGKGLNTTTDIRRHLFSGHRVIPTDDYFALILEYLADVFGIVEAEDGENDA